jgi:hypothetical protein
MLCEGSILDCTTLYKRVRETASIYEGRNVGLGRNKNRSFFITILWTSAAPIIGVHKMLGRCKNLSGRLTICELVPKAKS